MPWNHQQSDTDFLGHTLDLYDQQRDKKKAEEDQYLQWQQETIQHLLSSPQANQDPSVQQGLMNDLHNVVHARFTPRKRLRTMEGFMGATELPESSMLQSVMGGQRPMTGSPTQDVPPPPSALQDETGAPLLESKPQMGPPPQPPVEPGSIQRRHEAYAQSLGQGGAPSYQDLKKIGVTPYAPEGTMAPPAPQPFLPVSPGEAPTGGASVLQSPVAVPPPGQEPNETASRVVAAGRQMQQYNDGPKVIPVPPPRQPLLLDRTTADKEAGTRAGILEGAKYAARIQGEARGLTAPLPGDTEGLFTRPEAKAILQNREGKFGRSGSVGRVNGGTADVDGEKGVEVVQLPNGQFMRPDTQEVIEGAGRVYNFQAHGKAGGAAGAGITKVQLADGTLLAWDKPNNTVTPLGGPSAHLIGGTSKIVEGNVNGVPTSKLVLPNGQTMDVKYNSQGSAGGPAPATPNAPSTPGAPAAPAAGAQAGPPPGATPVGEAIQDPKTKVWMQEYSDGEAYVVTGPNGTAATVPQAPGAPGAPSAAAPGTFTPGKSGKPNPDEARMVLDVDKAIPMVRRLEAFMQQQWDPGKTGQALPNNWVKGKGSTLHGDMQALQFMSGHSPSDPYYKQITSLASLLRVMATAPYIHGVRNYKWITDIQQHTPNVSFPNVDTPANMADKLNNLKVTFNGFMSEIGRPLPFPEVGLGPGNPQVPVPPQGK